MEGAPSSHRRLADGSAWARRTAAQLEVDSVSSPAADALLQGPARHSSSRPVVVVPRVSPLDSATCRRQRRAPHSPRALRTAVTNTVAVLDTDTVVCCCHASVVVAGPPCQRPSCRSSQRGPVARPGGGVPGPGWRPAPQPRRVRGARPSSAAPAEPPARRARVRGRLPDPYKQAKASWVTATGTRRPGRRRRGAESLLSLSLD